MAAPKPVAPAAPTEDEGVASRVALVTTHNVASGIDESGVPLDHVGSPFDHVIEVHN
jgi:hypothetical protein